MEINILKSANYITSAWSGGSTTQLYIYPKHSEYKNLNFDFRLSKATVKAPISTFTLLKNINRKLIILNGSINIIKNNHHTHLNKFDIFEFSGNDNIVSEGICDDFNIMTSSAYNSEATSYIFENKNLKTFKIDKCDWVFIYVSKDEIVVEIKNDQQFIVKETELFLIENNSLKSIIVKSKAKSEIILTKIIPVL